MDDDDTCSLPAEAEFSPTSPDCNDNAGDNGRLAYTPNMPDYSPTTCDGEGYNAREFELGGATEEELEDIARAVEIDNNM